MPETFHQSSRSIKPLVQHRGVTIPTFLYGTAWKEAQTEALTCLAVECGFLGIDTANQRRHYDEAGVGRGIRCAFDNHKLQRSDLFLQTKFTFVAGQDNRLPYDPKADYTTQVKQSFASSLEHLETSYVDSYILHGPVSGSGLKAADWEVWRAMEALQKAGSAKLIGISNVTFEQLKLLIEKSEIKPAFVQNRCYARTQWDASIRALCHAHDLYYQGFSLLTANAIELNRPEIQKIARRLSCSVAQVVFRFCLQVGIIPLTGTTSKRHMQEDLAAYDIELSSADINTVENIAFLR
jgi:diketogulonate reductase-like aldo/keto reductase